MKSRVHFIGSAVGCSEANVWQNQFVQPVFAAFRRPARTAPPAETAFGLRQHNSMATFSPARSATRANAGPSRASAFSCRGASLATKWTSPCSTNELANFWICEPKSPVKLPAVTCKRQPRSTKGRRTPGWLSRPRLRSGWTKCRPRRQPSVHQGGGPTERRFRGAVPATRGGGGRRA